MKADVHGVCSNNGRHTRLARICLNDEGVGRGTTFMEQRSPGKPKIAFVLSGGAALGASQVGMLRALLERDIHPDLIVGTSIGAWNGLWLATHDHLEDLAKLEQIWRGITLLEVFGHNPMNLVINITNKRPFLVTEDGLERIFRRAAMLGDFSRRDLTFESLPIPFKITATNIMRGTSKVFDQGLIKPPLFASSSIPGLFPPVMIAGEQYVDGGLLDNGGVGVAVEAGADLIYVLSVAYAGIRAAPFTNMAELLERGFHLVSARHVRDAVQRYAHQAHFVVIEDEHAAQMSSLDFRHPAELMASGYRAAVATLDGEAATQATQAVMERASHPRPAAIFPNPATSMLFSQPAAPMSVNWFQQPAVMAALQTMAWVDCTIQLRRQDLKMRVRRPRPPVRFMAFASSRRA